MTKDEALQMCLEYIETDAHERKYVRHAIKQALAADVREPVATLFGSLPVYETPPVKEPVAWLVYAKGSRKYFTLTFDPNKVPEIYIGGEAVPLYTTLPAAQPAVPDAMTSADIQEHIEYIQGWNDCRAEMLGGKP